ncbi:MAG: hypothetical protein KF814_06345 [Nitrospiraceae bacterium]|nr:hypothetical protein [Nitrospiraceae bacterium]
MAPPSDLPDPSTRPTPQNDPQDAEEDERQRERHSNVIGMMVGTALMFIGFLNIFLSISGGFEINVVPFLIYFGGLAIWANSVVENLTMRYSVIGIALLLGLALAHYGEVLFWHKQVVFWGTVVVVMYFMFNEPKKPA